MHTTIEFLLHHGYVLLLGWVFAEQVGVPLPSMPLLLAAGALAGTGRMSLFAALFCVMLAAVAADSIWYQMGLRKGIAYLYGYGCIVCAVKEQHGYRRLWLDRLVEVIEVDAAAYVYDKFGNAGNEWWQRTQPGLIVQDGVPIERWCVEHNGLDVMGVGGTVQEFFDESASL